MKPTTVPSLLPLPNHFFLHPLISQPPPFFFLSSLLSLFSTVVSEELVLKQMKQMELSLGKLESELQHHKKPEQGDKFNDKMKVR